MQLAIPEPLLRYGLVESLSRVSVFEVVGEATTGKEALEALPSASPDVMIMSARLGDPSLSETCRAVRHRHGRCQVMLLVFDESKDIVLTAAQVGVRGLLPIDICADRIAMAIQSVHEGHFFYSKEALHFIFEDYAKSTQLAFASPTEDMPVTFSGDLSPEEEDQQSEVDHAPNIDQLSKREKQVLAAVARGMTSRDIAEELGISVRTVEAHRARVSFKLGIRSVAGLTRVALKAGLM